MANKALKGMKEVTRTAVNIAAGSYDNRVQVENSPEEILLLATTFNNMVDRLQEVVQGMREMTDNIAHDLRSPMARIRGIAEMTVTGEKSLHEYHEMAINTIEECDTLIEMINTMLEITETESGVARLKIEDNGVGIAEEDFPYIFNKFYRCDRSRSQPGTGLGLSLAKAITEAFGGNINVESSLNKGSVFTVALSHT